MIKLFNIFRKKSREKEQEKCVNPDYRYVIPENKKYYAYHTDEGVFVPIPAYISPDSQMQLIMCAFIPKEEFLSIIQDYCPELQISKNN